MKLQEGCKYIIFGVFFILTTLHQTGAWYDQHCYESCCDNAEWCQTIGAEKCYREEFMCCKRCKKLRIKGRETCEFGDMDGCNPELLVDPADCVGKRLKLCCDRCDEVLDDEYIEKWKKQKEEEEKKQKKEKKRKRKPKVKHFFDDED